MIWIYTTCKNKKEAVRISNHLIKNKLAACNNMFPISSVYRWKNKIVKDKEYALIIKTKNGKFNKIKNEIKKIHGYEVPCILKININKVNKEYLSWLNKEVK